MASAFSHAFVAIALGSAYARPPCALVLLGLVHYVLYSARCGRHRVCCGPTLQQPLGASGAVALALLCLCPQSMRGIAGFSSVRGFLVAMVEPCPVLLCRDRVARGSRRHDGWGARDCLLRAVRHDTLFFPLATGAGLSDQYRSVF